MTATSPIVRRSVAQAKPTLHRFIRGIGYLAHDGPPELPRGSNGKKNCAPPEGTPDGSIHLLQPPTGAPPMALKWSVKHSAWLSLEPSAGNRLGWPAEHLMKAGWEYVGVQKKKD